MQRDAGDRLTSGDLREFSRRGNGSERKIRAADFSHAWCLDGKHSAVRRDAQVRRGVIGKRGDELIWSGCIPHGDWATWRGAKSHKNVIARSRSLNERRSSETGNRRLRGRLNRWRARGEIHLSETCRTSAGGATFATETDENGLRASGCDARRTGVGEAGNTAGGHGGAGSQNRVEKIYILRAEIGDDELRIIGS